MNLYAWLSFAMQEIQQKSTNKPDECFKCQKKPARFNKWINWIINKDK